MAVSVRPAAGYQAFGLSKQARRDPVRVAEVVAHRVVGAEAESADERGAVMAATVALDYAQGRARAIAGSDGVIYLPRKRM